MTSLLGARRELRDVVSYWLWAEQGFNVSQLDCIIAVQMTTLSLGVHREGNV